MKTDFAALWLVPLLAGPFAAVSCDEQSGPDRTCPSAPAPDGYLLADNVYDCTSSDSGDGEVCRLRCIDPEVCPGADTGLYCVPCEALREWWTSECDGDPDCQSTWEGNELDAQCDQSR